MRTHRQTGAGSCLAPDGLSLLGRGWSGAHGGVASLRTNERQRLPSRRTDLGWLQIVASNNAAQNSAPSDPPAMMPM